MVETAVAVRPKKKKEQTGGWGGEKFKIGQNVYKIITVLNAMALYRVGRDGIQLFILGLT